MDDDREVDLVRTNPPSCSNCRRRKAKCDRAQPLCSNCVKAGRSCSYQSVWRTPLTRKHLTNIEEELAKTKALLKQSQSRTTPVIEVGSKTRRDASAEQTARVLQQLSPNDSLVSTEAPQQGSSVHFGSLPGSYRRGAGLVSGDSQVWNTNVGEDPSPVFSLEDPPAFGDFDWDERVGRTHNGRFVDGMASLTEKSSRGYMGVASGAAFLRLADDSAQDSIRDLDGQERMDTAANTPPIFPAIYTPAQLEPFIDAYFQTYHISYPIIHEATFRAQFMEIIPRPKRQSWQVLLHIVAAMGAFSAAEVAPEVDQGLFEAAKARMTVDMLETGNIVLVQALTLISNYVQKRNKPNSGYNYLGLANRMAMGIGLHKEFSAWHSQPLMLEIRRRVWHCLFIFNTGAIITFSRPLDIPRDGVEVRLPLNVSDSDITATTKEFPQESSQTCLYTHVRCQATFHLATMSIYERMISVLPTVEEMLILDEQHLVKWLNDLPAWFAEGVPQPHKRYRFCHAKLQWRWRNFRILMYRPYLMRRFMTRRQSNSQDNSLLSDGAEETAIQRCLGAASESVQLITSYWRTETRNVLTCWYGLYFLFQAIMIPMICLRNNPLAPTALSWRDQILDALDVITDMSRLNASAQRCHATIMKLCGFYMTTDIAQWNSPVHESPQTQLNAFHSFMWPMTDPQFLGGYDLALQESSYLDFLGQVNAG